MIKKVILYTMFIFILVAILFATATDKKENKCKFKTSIVFARTPGSIKKIEEWKKELREKNRIISWRADAHIDIISLRQSLSTSNSVNELLYIVKHSGAISNLKYLSTLMQINAQCARPVDKILWAGRKPDIVFDPSKLEETLSPYVIIDSVD